MKQANIRYFTGTGNSGRVCGIIAGELSAAGYESSVESIENVDPAGRGRADLWVFAFPVYACAVPSIMADWMKKLPPAKGAKAALISVFGSVDANEKVPGYDGQALYQARAILELKGYDVFFADGTGYPFNVPVSGVVPSQEKIPPILEKADAKIREFSVKIISGDRYIKKCNWFNAAWSWLFGLMFSVIGRRWFGKLYVADNSCVKCNKCVNSCPAKTIGMSFGILKWKWNCEGCQRCINICPKKSIQLSPARIITSLALSFMPWDSWIIGISGLNTAVNELGPVGIIVRIGFWFAGFVGAAFVADTVLFLLESIPGLGKLFRMGFVKKFSRYIAPGFKPGKQSAEPNKKRS
jgi:Pyruvate/2-oxoacid:ferredoxin oxidoreductase delta subunit/flavodoxin